MDFCIVKLLPLFQERGYVSFKMTSFLVCKIIALGEGGYISLQQQ